MTLSLSVSPTNRPSYAITSEILMKPTGRYPFSLLAYDIGLGFLFNFSSVRAWVPVGSTSRLPLTVTLTSYLALSYF